MKLAILTANLDSFDNVVKPIEQEKPIEIDDIVYYVFTDANFPPVTGLTPRLQYRIPKLFGWQMLPGFDFYVWLDASMTLNRKDSIQWLLEQLGSADAAFFKHPWRNSVTEEVEHIEDHLQKGKPYITSRYKNGLHREFLELIKHDSNYVDTLFASTAFIYRATTTMKNAMGFWWLYQSRYFSCDQVQLPYAMYQARASIKRINEDIFKNKYISLVSHHK